MRKSVMAGIVAAGAIGAALAVGGVAYAAGDPDTGSGEQIVRVVDQGEQGSPGDRDDCPDKAGNQGDQGDQGDQGTSESGTSGTGENL